LCIAQGLFPETEDPHLAAILLPTLQKIYPKLGKVGPGGFHVPGPSLDLEQVLLSNIDIGFRHEVAFQICFL